MPIRIFVTFGAAVVAALLVQGGRPSEAAITYPWCTTGGGMEFGGRNCGFDTMEQCLMTARGNGQHCEPNPMYQPAAPAPAKQVRHRKPANP